MKVAENYHDLIRLLAPLDRCHAGPDMDKAYDLLSEYYPGSRKIITPSGTRIAHWEIPPYWTCRSAELIAPDGKVIASRKQSNLAVFSYSPPFSGEIELAELESHLFSNPEMPDVTPFHFRNQYRHRSPEWGFCIPHAIRQKLTPGKYQVQIDSTLDYQGKMTQLDYSKKGRSDKEFIFMGHFDHADQVNDGLAGCVAAFEVIRRLQNKDTRFSYRAFASVEIAGSMAYLSQEKSVALNLQEGTFLALVGIDSPIIYQSSFFGGSVLDRAFRNVIDPTYSREVYFTHREKIGNDENVFDAVGYEVPMGTFLRWPFRNYHTSQDNFENYSPKSTEEIIEKTLLAVEVLENNAIVTGKFSGIPALASPEIDLYLSPTNISQSRDHSAKEKYGSLLREDVLQYLEKKPDLLYHFMRKTLRLADGKHTILDICEATQMPFSFAHWYIVKLAEKNLVKLTEVELG